MSGEPGSYSERVQQDLVLGPRVVERPRDRGWTLVGTLDGRAPARIDAGGLVTPHDAGWSLDWWIGADDRWYLPAREPAVRQRRLGAGPVIETTVRIPSGDARHVAYGALLAGREVTVVEVTNDSPVPVALALALRPYTVDGPTELEEIRLINLRDRTVQLGAGWRVILPRPPIESGGSASTDMLARVLAGHDLAWDRSGTGPVQGDVPNGALLYPLPHRTSLRVLVPAPLGRSAAEGGSGGADPVGRPRASMSAWRTFASTGRPSSPPGDRPSIAAEDDTVFAVGDAPDADHVARGWSAVVRAGADLDLPDPGVTGLLAGARARLLLASPPLGRHLCDLRPGAGLVLHGLAAAGHQREVRRALAALEATFPTRIRTDAAAAVGVLDGVARAVELSGRAPSIPLLETATQITSLIDRSTRRRFGRQIEPELAWTSAAARSALARLARLAGDAKGADRLDIDLRSDAERGPEPGEGHEALRNLGTGAGPAGSWDDDSATLAARYVLAARSTAVDDRHPDLVLVPDFPSAWRGGNLEVTALPTRFGALSFAIRWHGAHPAVLWDLDVAGGPSAVVQPRLTCPALDPSWITDEVRGEALLTGSAQPLPATPGPGDSFM